MVETTKCLNSVATSGSLHSAIRVDDFVVDDTTVVVLRHFVEDGKFLVCFPFFREGPEIPLLLFGLDLDPDTPVRTCVSVANSIPSVLMDPQVSEGDSKSPVGLRALQAEREVSVGVLTLQGEPGNANFLG